MTKKHYKQAASNSPVVKRQSKRNLANFLDAKKEPESQDKLNCIERKSQNYFKSGKRVHTRNLMQSENGN